MLLLITLYIKQIVKRNDCFFFIFEKVRKEIFIISSFKRQKIYDFRELYVHKVFEFFSNLTIQKWKNSKFSVVLTS
jgi:hypothetical protein